LDDPDSQEYQRAFTREVDERKAKTLKTAGTSKRFATMKLGRVATALYEALSKFDVHGGTSARFFAYSTETTPFTCSFSMRPVPASGRVVQHVKLLTDGYKTVCGEAIALVQNQGTLLAMVSRLFPPLIKGGQGRFTGKARHAQSGLLNMH
jgi:hypothetical protein